MEDQRAFNELVMDHFYPTRAAAGHETDGDVVLAANGTLRPTPHAATYLRPSEPTLTPTFTPTLTLTRHAAPHAATRGQVLRRAHLLRPAERQARRLLQCTRYIHRGRHPR